MFLENAYKVSTEMIIRTHIFKITILNDFGSAKKKVGIKLVRKRENDKINPNNVVKSYENIYEF